MPQLHEAHSESEQTIVPLPTGISLEVDLIRPSSPSTLDDEHRKLAVCLHPWSWLGGRKGDPVLHSLARPLLEAKYHILRYNSRGVGKSTGSASFTGFNEVEDLKALVQWALSRINNITSLVIIGYSHGSLIASLHPVLAPPIKTSHVLLSYPLGPRGWLTLFRASHYQEQLEQLLRDPGSNVLVIYGDNDEFTGNPSYQAWAQTLEKADEGGNRLRVEKVEDGSHFWRGQSNLELCQKLRRWLP